MTEKLKTYDYDADAPSAYPIPAQHPAAQAVIDKLYRLAGDLQKSTLVANPSKLRLTVDFPRREVQATITSHFFISDRD